MSDPSAADHLAELDARYDGHLAALRQQAGRLRDQTDAGIDALSAELPPLAPPAAAVAALPVPDRAVERAAGEPPPPVADDLLDFDDLPSFDDL